MTQPKPQLLRLNSLSLPLAQLPDSAAETALLTAAAAQRLGTTAEKIRITELRQKSLDIRDKRRPCFVYSVDVAAIGPLRRRHAAAPVPAEPRLTVADLHRYDGLRPLVVGAGPAGLFAALLLAQAGLRPLVLEQGRDVDARAADVARFWTSGTLDPRSNIQFGEGGAGAFSDGKLTSRSKDARGRLVLQTLVECGAGPEILYWHKPHVGSDRLPQVVAALRRRIEALGGEFRYGCTVQSLEISGGCLRGVSFADECGRPASLAAPHVVLAIGHSARPLYRALSDQVAMAAKPFAVGLRLAQPQAAVDRAQYGPWAAHPLLAAADYQLTWQDTATDRGVYTFCCCPGGQIVNASSAADALVVNGASDAARDGAWCNAAVVAQVTPGRDFPDEALAGLEFQERLERAAFAAGGGEHAVPVMAAQDFLSPGTAAAAVACEWALLRSAAWRTTDLRDVIGETLATALANALRHWEKQLPGFTAGAVLAAVESRTSAPLRLLRGPDGQALNCRGLFPAGEGAGYAGGIVSSAVDGLRAAAALIERLTAGS